MTVPRRQSVTGRRLCSGILTEGDFASGDITERGFEDYNNGNETSETDEGQADVRAGEEVPGFHV